MHLRLDKILLTTVFVALMAATIQAPVSANGCEAEDHLRVVDKQHALSRDDAPSDLVELAALDAPTFGRVQLRYYAALAFAHMAQAARAEGHRLVSVSGYRSYTQQRVIFWQNMQKELALAEEAGEPIDEATAVARANLGSAFAGQSEHQLGTTLDVSSRELGGALTQDLHTTPAGQWLLAHAHAYGFVVSYPLGKEHLTGYVSEPWHLRWVGERVAQELYDLKYLDADNEVTVASYLMQRKPTSCDNPFQP